MPGQTYTFLTVNGSPPNASGLSLTVAQTLDSTGPRCYGEKWYRCCQCGLDFPRSKVRIFQGKVYGIPCSDAKDIAQLARKGRK